MKAGPIQRGHIFDLPQYPASLGVVEDHGSETNPVCRIDEALNGPLRHAQPRPVVRRSGVKEVVAVVPRPQVPRLPPSAFGSGIEPSVEVAIGAQGIPGIVAFDVFDMIPIYRVPRPPRLVVDRVGIFNPQHIGIDVGGVVFHAGHLVVHAPRVVEDDQAVRLHAVDAGHVQVGVVCRDGRSPSQSEYQGNH